MKLQIIQPQLFDKYLLKFPNILKLKFDLLKDAELSTDTFSFYTSVASVFSSKIEGEKIELDSYIKHKRDGIAFLPDYTRKIDDLYNAYTFAKTNLLNQNNVSIVHQLLTKNILPVAHQGTYRTQNMYVASDDGKIEYVATLPQLVSEEMEKFYADLELILNTETSIEETFYYAAMIHLVFVKIHPWNDGNGRTARLLEKWFLAQKLGGKAWFVQSEKYYYQNHQTYYSNIRILGLEYDELDYSKSIPFLSMLANSVV
jgi:Fic family protein